jgi:hypothetical protein
LAAKEVFNSKEFEGNYEIEILKIVCELKLIEFDKIMNMAF